MEPALSITSRHCSFVFALAKQKDRDTQCMACLCVSVFLLMTVYMCVCACVCPCVSVCVGAYISVCGGGMGRYMCVERWKGDIVSKYSRYEQNKNRTGDGSSS